MQVYRCLALDRGRRVVADSPVDARTDADAISIVRRAKSMHDCDIWCLTRLVAQIPAGGGLPIYPTWGF